MATGIVEVIAAYQFVQPIIATQIQLIKDIYTSVEYIRKLIKEYKARFEILAALVDEVDSRYIRLSKLLEGLEQLSSGNALDETNLEAIGRKLKSLDTDLQRVRSTLEEFMEKLKIKSDSKIKRFIFGLDFASAGRLQLQEALKTSNYLFDSITMELLFLLVMDNHRVLLENKPFEGSLGDRSDCFELFKSLNVTKITSNAPILRLVKQITVAREKALALEKLSLDELTTKVVLNGNSWKADIDTLEADSDVIYGKQLVVYRGISEKFPHCIIDQRRPNYNGRTFEDCLRDTMFVATILSSDKFGPGDDKFAGKEEDKNIHENQNHDELDRTIGNLPKCVGVTTEEPYLSYNFNLIFELPSYTDPKVRSLRKALTDPESLNHPIDDRYNLSLRLAQSIFLLHSAGLIHRQIRPEVILLTNRLDSRREDRYPKRLGQPFLFGFEEMRADEGHTRKAGFNPRPMRSLAYKPPRHLGFEGERKDRYRMIDDIYGLGVCLLEIGLWESLFKYDLKGKSYIENEEAFDFSDKSFYDIQSDLIKKAKEEIPRKLGIRFMEVVVACLDCFNTENLGGFGEIGVDAPPSMFLRKYEVVVLDKLRELVNRN